MKLVAADHSGESWRFCEIDAVSDPSGVDKFVNSLGEMYLTMAGEYGYGDDEMDDVKQDIIDMKGKIKRGAVDLSVEACCREKFSIKRDVLEDDKQLISIRSDGWGGYDHLLDFSGFEIVKEHCVDKTGEAYIDPSEIDTTCSIKKRGNPITVKDIYKLR